MSRSIGYVLTESSYHKEIHIKYENTSTQSLFKKFKNEQI